jgi:hypothetical protein
MTVLESWYYQRMRNCGKLQLVNYGIGLVLRNGCHVTEDAMQRVL